jgi:hypothetical protein
MWTEPVMAQIKILSQHFLEELRKIIKILSQEGCCLPVLEPDMQCVRDSA